MAINVKSYSDITRKDVFTDRGVYAGKVVDVGLDLERFRVRSLVVDAVRGSFLASLVGEKKGVVVPFTMVKSVGDIVLIKHIQAAVEEEQSVEEKPTAARL